MPKSIVEEFAPLIERMNNAVSKKDFLNAFKNVVRIMLDVSRKLDANCAELQGEFDSFKQKIEEDNAADIEEFKKMANLAVAGAIQGMSDSHENRVAKLEGKVDALHNTDEVALLAQMQALIPEQKIATPVEIRDALESLGGDDRLDLNAIRGLEEAIAKAQKDGKPIRIGAGRTGLYILVGGKKVGIVNMLNFAPGNGMAIAFSIIKGGATLTFTSSGGGSTVETPTGIVNGVNTQFKPTSEPKYVVADGTTYFENNGYTWDGTNINMTIAPSSFIRDVF